MENWFSCPGFTLEEEQSQKENSFQQTFDKSLSCAVSVVAL